MRDEPNLVFGGLKASEIARIVVGVMEGSDANAFLPPGPKSMELT